MTLNLCKKGTVLTISHTSLWLQMERCTGHSYLKIQLLPSRIFFSLEFIFLVAITSKKTYKKGRGGGGGHHSRFFDSTVAISASNVIYAKELGRPPVKPNTFLAGESYQNRYKTISTVKGTFLPVYSGDWRNFSWLAPIILLLSIQSFFKILS